MTKSEIAGGRDTDAAIDAVRSLAPRALIRRGTTDEHAAWLEEILSDPPVTRPIGQDKPHVHDESCRHPDGSTAHGIDSVWVPVQGVLDLEELEDQLAELPDNYVRIKGILRSVDGRRGSDAAQWTAIHRVGLRVSSEPVSPPQLGEGLEEGCVVALGPDVDEDRLAACVGAAGIRLAT